jgi:hypothetical protein
MNTTTQTVKEAKTYRELRDLLNCLGERQLDQAISVDGTLEDVSIVGISIREDDLIRHPDGECIGDRCEVIKHYSVDDVWMWEVLEPAGTVSVVVDCS